MAGQTAVPATESRFVSLGRAELIEGHRDPQVPQWSSVGGFVFQQWSTGVCELEGKGKGPKTAAIDSDDAAQQGGA